MLQLEQKSKILLMCLNEIETKIERTKAAIKETRDSANNETKSSLGDKHETSRAMAHLEIEKSEFNLSNLINNKEKLQKIDVSKPCHQVMNGSLIETNMGLLFVSTGMGKLQFEDKEIITISLDSPLFIGIKGLHKGENTTFNKKEIHIIDLV